MSIDVESTTPQRSNDTTQEVCKNIDAAGELAVQTNDFLSFATVLDIQLGDPTIFTSEEVTVIFTHLYKTLNDNHVSIYKIGWDMLELLCRYVDHFTVGDVGKLAAMTPFRLVMALLSLICEHGNPRELMLRSCELMLSYEAKRNEERLAAMSLEDKDDGNETCTFQDNDDFHTGFDSLYVSRKDNVKFCTLFEVIRFSLQKINTPFPSSFLLEAASTLLQVANDPNADLLSIATYGRRMYLLARDFRMSEDCNVSQEEMQRVRNILVNFLSHACEVLVKRFSLKYSERLFLQMRHKVMCAPQKDRENVYCGTECTNRMCEVTSRISQLMLSFDFDPADALHSLLGVKCVNGELREHAGGLPSTKVEGVELLANNYWSQQILKGPSLSGLCILKTQLHYDGNRNIDWNVKMAAMYSLQINKTLQNTACKTDVLLYWALWTANFFGPQTARQIDEPLLTEYLQMHLHLISSSECREEQFVTGSVIARALRFQSSDYSYNFCINVMKTSSSSAEHFVAVEALKTLVNCKNDLQEASNRPIELTPERKYEIAMVAKDSLFRLKKETNRFPFYYLNLLTVVPTDKRVLIQLVDEINTFIASVIDRIDTFPESCQLQLKVLQEGVTKLSSYANSL